MKKGVVVEKLKRRAFTADFKIEAVKLMTESRLSYAEAGRRLDVLAKLVKNWEDTYRVGKIIADARRLRVTVEQMELSKLRKEIQELKMERDILWPEASPKKAAASHGISFGHRPEAQRTLDAQRLLFQIKTLFNQYQRRYGAPRIYRELMEQYGYDGSLARVKRLMRQAGLRAKAKHKFKATTDSNHAHPIAANLLDQQFRAARPNQTWLSDLTYIRTQEGWLYLAAVLDLYTREIVGWAIGSRMTQQLVIDALRMAWFRKHPGKHSQLIFHSDRGSQYASLDFRKVLTDYGMRQSMSGTGNCYDNAPMESFWHSLKVEEVHGCNYTTREEATRAIFTYIEIFYNCERRHSSIDYLSPRQFEKQFYEQ